MPRGHTAHKQKTQGSHSDLCHAYMLAGHTKPSSLEEPGTLDRERMPQGDELQYRGEGVAGESSGPYLTQILRSSKGKTEM